MTQNNGPAFVDTNVWLYAFIGGKGRLQIVNPFAKRTSG